MKTLNRILAVGATAAVLCLSRQNAVAQPDFGGGGGNFDPQQMMQQMQSRVVDGIREQLDVTNDTEWAALEPLVTKVVKVRMTSMMGGMGGMRGMMGGRGGGGPGGPGGGGPGGPGGGGFGAMMGGQADPTADALQKAIDDKAPADQIKAALGKYRDSKKAKAAEVTKAQDQLRSVLNLRQEAVLVSMGMLD